jgi:hypothetical protein
MKRREFIALLGGATAMWSLAGHSEQANLPVVGFLNSAAPDGYASMAAAFKQGLNESGFFEGRNVRIEYRWGGKSVRALASTCGGLGQPPGIRHFREQPFGFGGQGVN